MRRLPVYLLIDCSESMAGAAIDAINLAVPGMVRELCKMPHALETVAMSVIIFSGDARVVVPLTPLDMFKLPRLTIYPGTSLGRALDMLAACIEADVVVTTKERKGDWLPLVFLFTDGQPTDDWRGAVERIKKLAMSQVISYNADQADHMKIQTPERTNSPKIAGIYAIGCGDDVDYSILHEITNNVYKTSDINAEAINNAFVWITASVRYASMSVAGEMVCLPEPPPGCGLKEVPKDENAFSDHEPRQVFVHAKCSKTGNDYLMRFARENGIDGYVATAVHKLEGHSSGFGATLPPVQASRLIGMVACAYCSNESVAICGCGGAMCFDANHAGGIICPHCGTELDGEFITGDFSIRQSAG